MMNLKRIWTDFYTLRPFQWFFAVKTYRNKVEQKVTEFREKVSSSADTFGRPDWISSVNFRNKDAQLEGLH